MAKNMKRCGSELTETSPKRLYSAPKKTLVAAPKKKLFTAKKKTLSRK